MRQFGLRFQRLIIVSCLLRQTPACTQKVQIHSMTYFAKSLLFKHAFGACAQEEKTHPTQPLPLTFSRPGDIVFPLNRLWRRRTRKSGGQRGARLLWAPSARGGCTAPEPPGMTGTGPSRYRRSQAARDPMRALCSRFFLQAGWNRGVLDRFTPGQQGWSVFVFAPNQKIHR